MLLRCVLVFLVERTVMEHTLKLVVSLDHLSFLMFSHAVLFQMGHVAKRWVVASTETVQEALLLCRG